MSDFLGRLAGRAMAAVPVAQPLLPSAFAAASAPSTFTETAIEHEAEPPPVRKTPAGAPTDASEVPEAHTQPAESNVIEPRTAPAIAPRDKAQQQPVQQHGAPVRVAAATAVQAEAVPISVAAPVQPSRVELDQSIPRQAAPDLEAPLSPRRPAPPAGKRQAERPIQTVVHQMAAAEPELPRQSVRVTIGRVDVRAEFPTPAAPAPARRNESRTLSLDQYLEQRLGGKR